MYWSLGSNLRKTFLQKVRLGKFLKCSWEKEKTKMYRIMMLNLGIYFFHMCLKEVYDIGAINTIGTNTNTTGTNERTGGQILHNVAQSGVSSYSCGVIYYISVSHLRKCHLSTDIMYLYIYDNYLMAIRCYIKTSITIGSQAYWDSTPLFWTHVKMPSGLSIVIHNTMLYHMEITN